MTALCVNASKLSGSITIPSSKSHSIRALFFAMMAAGTSVIDELLDSPDIEAAIAACQAFGARVERQTSHTIVHGVAGKPRAPTALIDVGNSGLVLRFAAALAALIDAETIITGDASICQLRPIQPLLDGLNGLGARAVSIQGNGFAPVSIRGTISPGITHLCGKDSQPVSALLTAASFLDGPSEIHVSSPGEQPWIDLTLAWFNRLGIAYNHDSYSRYRLNGTAHYPGFSIAVPGDFSTAAFPLAAAAITQSEVTLHNLDMGDCQGDKKIIDILKAMGANIVYDPQQHTVQVKKGAMLKGVTVDLAEIIDAVPILAVVGCFAEGEMRLVNGAIARHKESDRIACMTRELTRMGAKITEKADGMIIKQSSLQGAEVDSYRDHRVAMALAVAGLSSSGTTYVQNSDCIAKTYKRFVDDMTLLGAQINEVPIESCSHRI